MAGASASSPSPSAPVALVTGGARRIGAAIARTFHQRGYRVVLHCRRSLAEAEALARQCNAHRPGSAALLAADLAAAPEAGAERLAEQAVEAFQRIDVLVNNASSYYSTIFGEVSPEQWDDLLGSNLRGHFFLSQALAGELRRRSGAIVNIVDVQADRPPRGYSAYGIAKAGLKAMTRSLALELAPSVRVNAIAPGPVLWPEHLLDEAAPGVTEARRKILQSTATGKLGDPGQLAELCWFLATEASYTTGQTLRFA